MALDAKFLRQHYAAMSDEELFSIDRDELVEAAQQIYDEEVSTREVAESEAQADRPGPSEEDVESAPDWLEDAAEAFTVYDVRGGTPAPEVARAHDALDGARIPAYVELCEEPEPRWRVLVPSKLVHRATSVLDRDVFNEQFEFELRNHLELLSDEELRIMEPRFAFCGLYDRLERINRAYDDELERRHLKK